MNKLYIFLCLIFSSMSVNAAAGTCVNNNCEEHGNRIQDTTTIQILSELENAAELRRECVTDNVRTRLSTRHSRYEKINSILLTRRSQGAEKIVEVVLNENSTECEITTLVLID